MLKIFYRVTLAVCFLLMGSVYPIRASAHPHLIVNAVDEYVHLFGGANENTIRAKKNWGEKFSDSGA